MFLPLEHKIHIFSPLCNIRHISSSWFSCGFSVLLYWSNWNLEVLVFQKTKDKNQSTRGKSSKRAEKHTQTPPTLMTPGLNQTWATLMGDKCSHHCTNSACLIHAHTDHFFSDASYENIRNLYCLLSHAILTSQECESEGFGSFSEII